MRRYLLPLILAMTLVTPPAQAAEVIGGEKLAGPGLVVGAPTNNEESLPPFPDNPATSYVVADLTTNQVLAAKNAHQQLRPASTIKALTALTLLPILKPNQVYRVQRADTKVETTKIGLIAGRNYSVESLFYALMLHSANDAGMALAGAAGGMSRTIELMSQEAKRIQAFDTVPKTPHGLDAPGQVTSAYDLALIAKNGLQRPEFAKIVGTWWYRFKDMQTKPRVQNITNHNRLLKKYRGMVGVKNGYTRAAQNTYIGAAERNGHTIVVTLMHLPVSYSRDKAASAMLNWGFAVTGKIEPVGVLVDAVSPPVDQRPALSVVTSKMASTTSELPGFVRYLAVPFVLVALLRTRVLVRRQLRRRKRRARYSARMNPTLR